MHGFRSSFRTWARKQGRYGHDVMELALAHEKDALTAAYERDDLLEERRPLMADWADFVTAGEVRYPCAPNRGQGWTVTTSRAAQRGSGSAIGVERVGARQRIDVIVDLGFEISNAPRADFDRHRKIDVIQPHSLDRRMADSEFANDFPAVDELSPASLGLHVLLLVKRFSVFRIPHISQAYQARTCREPQRVVDKS